MRQTESPKVIGIGLHKTGTTTLQHCLSELGYRSLGYEKHVMLLYHAGEINAIMALMQYFDSFSDHPWALLYREACARFPDARFILTTRIDEKVWCNSLSAHTERHSHSDEELLNPMTPRNLKRLYGSTMPILANKDQFIRKYRQHNEDVRAFFADKKESFLEVCWERGDGWPELCRFLDVPVPDMPLPHKNKKPGVVGWFISKIKLIIKRKLQPLYYWLSRI